MRIRVNGRVFAPEASPVTIGRDTGATINFDDERVSRRHAVLEASSGSWVFRDVGSTNGSFREGTRVAEYPISGPVTLRLGDAEAGPVLELGLESEPPSATAERGASSPPARGRKRTKASDASSGRGRVRIGRAESNDIVVAGDLRVSRFHAELRKTPDGRDELVDLGSANGTFVNGVRVKQCLLDEADLVGIGSALYFFSDGRLEAAKEAEAATFEAVGLSVVVEGGKKILDSVSIFLEPSSVLAVVGPSGAGKSTLLNALTGFRPADEGAVYFGGRDLYASYEELRSRMGYVPQEDILHPQLTVQRALEFSAELRFSPDVDAGERGTRIDEVLSELGLSESRNQRISSLSGGQRKRVSVALELLTKPAFLFLDEPTSGLDPGNERELMELVRELARGGRIVIVVTHSVQSLDLCDRVVFLAPGGKTAYFGPPDAALRYFEFETSERTYAALFTLLDRSRDVEWKELYEQSPLREKYLGAPAAHRAGASGTRGRPLPPRRQQSRLRQLQILTRRNAAVMLGDRRAVLFLLLQAPVLGLLYWVLFQRNKLSTSLGHEATLVVWLLAIGATWFGISNATREIVKEFPVYRRERSVGLSIGAYVGSKVLVLSAITLVQSAVLVGILLISQRVPPTDLADVQGQYPEYFERLSPFDEGAAISSAKLELVIGVALAGVAGVGLGLLVSALVRSSDQSLAILPVLLAAQIVLSIPTSDVNSGAVRALGNLSTAQWGNAAQASTVSLNGLRLRLELGTEQGRVLARYPQPPLPIQEHAQDWLTYVRAVLPELGEAQQRALDNRTARWEHRGSTWFTNVAILLGFTFVSTGGAWLALRARDPRMLAGETAVRAGPGRRRRAATA